MDAMRCSNLGEISVSALRLELAPRFSSGLVCAIVGLFLVSRLVRCTAYSINIRNGDNMRARSKGLQYGGCGSGP